MSIKGISIVSLSLACAAYAGAPATPTTPSTQLTTAAGQPTSITPAQSIAHFQSVNQKTGVSYRADGSIGRVYGKAFSQGQTSAISTSRFLDQNLAMWGVPANELVAEGPFDDGHHTQQIGYLPEFDDYKFTGHYYKQIVGGLPVFRSKLVLLTRNEANNPLVLASSELRNLNGFQLDPQLNRQAINHDRIVKNAEAHFNLGAILDSSERVIYAGVENAPHAPVLADKSTVEINGFEKHLVITDAVTGQVLFTESLIHVLDISGNVSGVASEGPGADICENEIPRALPYLNVAGPSGNTQTDANGNYTLPNAGTSAVNVSSTLNGQWFRILDFLGAVTSETESVTPPGPGDLLLNPTNSSENIRAQVNAYIEANVVRDAAIAANPAYPGTQFQMNVTVNRTDGFCPGNAWYDPGLQDINFCLSGGSNPNTAWSSVVHHEYGHHLVNAGGSGQGQYGEGMGDVMSAIILDDSRLGLGFFGSCGSSLRNANNSHQYPCSGGIHDCGQLISGCVWDTREAMVASGVSNYSDVLNFLAVNSILVHSGDTITPQITIDWLTLDDDDADIGNGTPHYAEIATGFGAHNMDAPVLNLMSISFPGGQPDLVSPTGDTTMLVDFQPISGSVDPSSPVLMVNTGAGFVGVPMTQNGPTLFEAAFPASTCGAEVSYYITSQTTGGGTQLSPNGAPFQGTHSAISAVGTPVVTFQDDFQTNQGWTVSGSATDGQWNRGVPVNCNRGDPATDFDGSGMCYLTDNSAGNACNSDVDGGATTLTSPIMDASGDATVVSYTRWYDNSFGAEPLADVFVVQVSDDAGASWVNLETVGPAGSEVTGGWISKQFSLNSIFGFVTNDQFRIRFTASDNGGGSVVEAGVDGVKLEQFACTDDSCVADLNGDGVLDFFDISAFLTAFSASDLAADFNSDGVLDFFDISAFLSEFSAGCP